MSKCCDHGYAWDKLCPICSKITPLKAENAIFREALEQIVKLKDNQSLSYERWHLMVDVAVKALQRAGGGE